MEKVIVSLAAISSRMESLHLVLASLLSQNYPNFEIRVHVSSDKFLLDEGVHEIPESCKILINNNIDKIKWLYTRNIGSYRKLLPVLVDPEIHDSLIATADDDTVYPEDWLSTLVYYYRIHRCIISYRGHFMKKDANGFVPYRRWMGTEIKKNPSLFLLPTGKDGVLYHPSFFDKNIINIHQALHYARTADDLWFKWCTAVNKVPVYLVHTSYESDTLESVESDGPSLYSSFNKGGGNDRSILALEEFFISRGETPLAKIHE